MFKRCLMTLMILGVFSALSTAAFSQDDTSANQQAAPEHGHGRRHFDPAKRTEMLTKELNLTSDQQSKVQDILKSEQSKMESLRSDTSIAPEDHRSKMMDIHKESSDQIRALLDSNQQRKWDEMQSRHQRWEGHHGMEKPDGASQDSSQPK